MTNRGSEMIKKWSLKGLVVFIGLSFAIYSQAQEALDARERKKILVVGDSLSAAYKLSKEQGWVYLLDLRLREKNIPVDVVNASISGATTVVGLQLLPKALEAHSPDFVILELGANDGLQGKPVPYIKKNLARLIEMSLEAKVEVMLVGVRLPPNFGKRYTEPFYQQFGELVKVYDLNYVPFLMEGVAGNSDLMMRDGLHPNAKAQALVLENTWPSIEKMLNLKGG